MSAWMSLISWMAVCQCVREATKLTETEQAEHTLQKKAEEMDYRSGNAGVGISVQFLYCIVGTLTRE